MTKIYLPIGVVVSHNFLFDYGIVDQVSSAVTSHNTMFDTREGWRNIFSLFVHIDLFRLTLQHTAFIHAHDCSMTASNFWTHVTPLPLTEVVYYHRQIYHQTLHRHHIDIPSSSPLWNTDYRPRRHRSNLASILAQLPMPVSPMVSSSCRWCLCFSYCLRMVKVSAVLATE